MDEAHTSLFDEPTATEHLAEATGLSLHDFREVFGDGWFLLEEQGTDYDGDPTGSGWVFGPWYAAGSPVQLMLRPLEQGRVELGVPSPRGRGAMVFWAVSDRVELAGGPSLLESAPGVVTDLLRRRRSTFRYCRYCRSLTPPEGRVAADVCAACAGVVF